MVADGCGAPAGSVLGGGAECSELRVRGAGPGGQHQGRGGEGQDRSWRGEVVLIQTRYTWPYQGGLTVIAAQHVLTTLCV